MVRIEFSRSTTLLLITFSPCPIMIGNNTPISITDHEPDPEFETTLRVLNVSTEPPQHPQG